MTRFRVGVAACAALAVLITNATLVLAYPTAIAFVPSADVLGVGMLRIDTYAVARVSPSPVELTAAAGAFTLGLSPGWQPRAAGPRFLLLEAGLDIVRIPDADTLVLGSAKLALVQEHEWMPTVSIGALAWSLRDLPGLAFGYAVITKRMTLRGINLGRFTGGVVRSFTKQAELPPDCIALSACAFRGSFPFSDTTNAAVLLGYELPLPAPFYVGIDHFGGTSAFGATNVIVGYTIGALSFSLGAYFTTDRRRSVLGQEPWDGTFAGISYLTDLWTKAMAQP